VSFRLGKPGAGGESAAGHVPHEKSCRAERPDGKHRGMEYYTTENAVYPVPLNRKKTAIQ
jgi:hypothetical protein